MSQHEKAAAAPAPAEAKSGGSTKGKLLIGGFLAGFVVVEVVLAYIFIPSADQVAAMAQEKMAKQLPQVEEEHGSEEGGEKDDAVVEVDLGQYTVTVVQSATSQALRIDFHLVGVALSKDESDALELFEKHTHRFRDQVLSEIRNSDMADITDPELGLIKRRILEKSNTLFGKPVLLGIVFSDFSYIEQ